MEPQITLADVLARPEFRAMRAQIQETYAWINPGLSGPDPAMERRYHELRAAYVRAVNAALFAAGLPPYEGVGRPEGGYEYPGYGPASEEGQS